VPSDDVVEKIQLTFSHKPSIVRTSLDLNVTRKKILDFKDEMLVKK